MAATRRPAPKLRTKTGCFTCRRRRKKCNEHKPTCSDCKRHALECVWPVPETNSELQALPTRGKGGILVEERSIVKSRASPSSDDNSDSSPFSDDSTKIGLARSAIYGLPGVKTSLDHYLSLYFRERYMRLLWRPYAHPAFGDSRPLVMFGAERSATMNVLLANAAMHASHTNPKLKPVAARYYNSVLTSMRTAIDTRAVKGNEDRLLLMANFSLLFEIQQGWNSRYVSGVPQHLEGMATLLSMKLAEDMRNPEKVLSPVDRSVSESLLYYMSTMNLFYGKVDRLGDMISWDDLSLYLNYELFPGASAMMNSPLLGGRWKLYRRNFEIVCLSHQTPLSIEAERRGKDLELALYEEEEEIRNERNDPQKHQPIQDMLRQSLLYILAAQILIFKTIRPETSCRHPRIRNIMTDAINSFKEIPIAIDGGISMLWPLVIFACAVTTEDETAFLRERIGMIWSTSKAGEARRVKAAVETLWARTSITDNKDDSMKSLAMAKCLMYCCITAGFSVIHTWIDLNDRTCLQNFRYKSLK